MSITIRERGPLYVASITAIIILIEYFISGTFIDPLKDTIVNFGTIIGIFGGLFATTTLLVRYGTPWFRGAKLGSNEKILNLTFWVFWVVTAALCFTEGRGGPTTSIFYAAFQRAPMATSWAMFGVFMLWSTYRIFKARDWGTLVFAISMIVWLTKMAPSGGLIPGVTELGNWVINYPSKGGIRAGTIAYGLGAFVLGLRIVITKERGLIQRLRSS
jgi:hypothetical protein